MAPVAALLDSRAALAAVKRTLPKGEGPIVGCRRPARFADLVASRPIDGIVLGTRASRRVDLALLRERFPAVPLVVYGTARSDEAALVLDYYERFGAAAFLVEGVDDAIVGDVIARSTVTARRRAQLAGVPVRLRLTEPLQQQAFEILTGTHGRRPSTATLARRLEVSREHLSRRFGAGGAPNLKRMVDLFQVIAARDLLQNPGYPLAAVARLLGYSTPNHLRVVIRRVVGLGARDLARAQSPELVRRFLAVGARSRA